MSRKHQISCSVYLLQSNVRSFMANLPWLSQRSHYQSYSVAFVSLTVQLLWWYSNKRHHRHQYYHQSYCTVTPIYSRYRVVLEMSHPKRGILLCKCCTTCVSHMQVEKRSKLWKESWVLLKKSYKLNQSPKWWVNQQKYNSEERVRERVNHRRREIKSHLAQAIS